MSAKERNFKLVAVSFLGLAYLSSFLTRRSTVSNGQSSTGGSLLANPLRLAVLISIGIGLHNFAEGLAIGQAAASGDVRLALLLIVGFGLHNATEGFGITGPLIGRVRPSWMFLLLVGLIGGSPTFFGTIVGRVYTSDVVSILFLALAAGSIIYVVQTLVYSGLSSNKQGAFSIGLLAGFIAGIATDPWLLPALASSSGINACQSKHYNSFTGYEASWDKNFNGARHDLENCRSYGYWLSIFLLGLLSRIPGPAYHNVL